MLMILNPFIFWLISSKNTTNYVQNVILYYIFIFITAATKTTTKMTQLFIAVSFSHTHTQYIWFSINLKAYYYEYKWWCTAQHITAEFCQIYINITQYLRFLKKKTKKKTNAGKKSSKYCNLNIFKEEIFALIFLFIF